MDRQDIDLLVIKELTEKGLDPIKMDKIIFDAIADILEKQLRLRVVGSSFKLGQKVYSAWRDNELIIEAVGFDGCYLRDNEDGEVEWHDDSEIYLH